MTRKATKDQLTDAERKAIEPFIDRHIQTGKPLSIEKIKAIPLMRRRLTEEELMKCIRSEVQMARVNFDHARTKKARTEQMAARTKMMAADLVTERAQAQILKTEVEEERKSKMEVLRQVEEEKQAALEAQCKAEEERNAKLEAEERAKEEKQAALEALHKVEEERKARIEAEERVKEERVAALEAEDKVEKERQARIEFQKRMKVLDDERMALESQCDASKKAIERLKSALSIAKESHGQHKPDETQIKKLELQLIKAKSEAKIQYEMRAQVQAALEAKNQEIEAQNAALVKSCSEEKEKLRAAKFTNVDELIKQHDLMVKTVYKVDQDLRLSNLRLVSFNCGPTLEAEIKAVSPTVLGIQATRTNMESVRKQIIERWQVLLERSGTLDAFSLRCCLPKPKYLMSSWLEFRNKFAHQKEAQEMSLQDHVKYHRMTRQLVTIFRDVADVTRGYQVNLMRFEDVE